MADEQLTYSDLIKPDNAINDLIRDLESLGTEYGTLTDQVKRSAAEIQAVLNTASSATSVGKKAIEEAVANANQLNNAYKSLKHGMTETGKALDYFRQKQLEHNKVSKDEYALFQSFIAQYKSCSDAVRTAADAYLALTDAQRKDASIAGPLLSTIANSSGVMANLSKQLRIQKTTQDKLNEAKAEYIRIMQSIDSHDKSKLTTADDTTRETAELKAYNKAINEQIRMKQLEAQVNASAQGSYRQMSYEYELLALKIRNMSTADEESVKIKEELIQKARLLKQTLKEEDEALGDYHRSVGNYNVIWNGLRYETSQLIRELPAATVSLNNFFLALSNNIPMFVDQIENLKRKNKDLKAEGQPTESIIGEIVSALFSWQTAIVVGITLLTQYGEEIWDWCKGLIYGKDKVMELNEALDNINDEFLENIDNYGKNIVSLKNLANEWKRLQTEASKLQWIKDNQDAFKTLDINIRGVTDAENIFVGNTEVMIKAFKLRARAAAAQTLASKSYEEALKKQVEAENLEKREVSGWEQFKAFWTAQPGLVNKEVGRQRREKANELKAEAKALEGTAEQYFELGKEALTSEQLLYNMIDAERYHKKDGKDRGYGRGYDRDYENELWRRYLEIQKKYEASITALERDEYIKRVREAQDASAAKIRALEAEYEKNERILNGQDKRYTKVTEEQKDRIKQAQEWIVETIKNYQEKLNFDLEQIEKDRQLHELENARETINLRLESLREGSAEELDLRIKLLKNQREAELIENSKLYEKDRQAELDIVMKYNKQIEDLERQRRLKVYEAAKDNYDLQLTLAREKSTEELQIKLGQLDLEEQIALESNRQLDKSLQADEQLIKDSYARRRALLQGEYSVEAFDLQQEVDQAKFDEVKHTQAQITKFTLEAERDRWERLLELAEEGALDWGDEQIAIAKSNIERINNALKDVSLLGQIGSEGLGYGLLNFLGFNEDEIDAWKVWWGQIMDSLDEIMDAEVELAEQAKKIADEQVANAQSAVEAEIEARNNGYAHNVATAKKELEQEKKNQREKQKILEQAQRKQEVVNALAQASNLVSATALIWAQLGFPWAIPAIASMWALFGVAKVKAYQVTRTSEQEYGEGGLEFLEGGSHASGNDIDLKTKNHKGKNMRAEGGEALAIINKRQTRRYRKVLPNIIESLNRGTFEDRYLNAFSDADNLNLQLNSNKVDLSTIEKELITMRKQNSVKTHILPNGDVMVIDGNVKRIIKAN